MIDSNKREYFINELSFDVALFENPSFDNSIVGVTSEGHLVYNFNYMVDELMQDEEMTETDAIEFIEYNTMQSLPYIEEEIRPIIMYELVI